MAKSTFIVEVTFKNNSALQTEKWPECRNKQSHTTKAFPRHILILLYGPLKSKLNIIKPPWTMENKVNYIQVITFINVIS